MVLPQRLRLLRLLQLLPSKVMSKTGHAFGCAPFFWQRLTQWGSSSVCVPSILPGNRRRPAGLPDPSPSKRLPSGTWLGTFAQSGRRPCAPRSGPRPSRFPAEPSSPWAVQPWADSSAHLPSCAPSNAGDASRDTLHPAPSPTDSFGGTPSPCFFKSSSTSRQLWLDSRMPSSMARKCFSPRSLTPMITRANSFWLSARRPL